MTVGTVGTVGMKDERGNDVKFDKKNGQTFAVTFSVRGNRSGVTPPHCFLLSGERMDLAPGHT